MGNSSKKQNLNIESNKNNHSKPTRMKKETNIFLEVSPSNEFESLPKLILNKIFGYFSIAELRNVTLLNRFFYNLLMNKKTVSSQAIWKEKYKEYFGFEELNEEELINSIRNKELDEIETNLNLHYLALKYCMQIKNVDEQMVIYQKEGKKHIFEYI